MGLCPYSSRLHRGINATSRRRGMHREDMGDLLAVQDAYNAKRCWLIGWSSVQQRERRRQQLQYHVGRLTVTREQHYAFSSNDLRLPSDCASLKTKMSLSASRRNTTLPGLRITHFRYIQEYLRPTVVLKLIEVDRSKMVVRAIERSWDRIHHTDRCASMDRLIDWLVKVR